jgi:hypothetical protein
MAPLSPNNGQIVRPLRISFHFPAFLDRKPDSEPKGLRHIWVTADVATVPEDLQSHILE